MTRRWRNWPMSRAIPRGRPGQVALHGATLVGLEAMVLSLAAAKPEAALASLDNLNRLRRATEVREAKGRCAKRQPRKTPVAWSSRRKLRTQRTAL